MDIKIEQQFLWVDPKLPADQQSQVKEKLVQASQGASQNLIGDKRREIANSFLEILDPERRKRLEEQISTLHGIKDDARFRVQLILLLIDAFHGGVLCGQEPKAESPNPPKS